MRNLPEPRGDISDQLLAALRGDVRPLPVVDVGEPADALADEDLQLALYVCYELHYRTPPGGRARSRSRWRRR